MAGEKHQVLIVHHNPNSGRYRYEEDPDDAIALGKGAD